MADKNINKKVLVELIAEENGLTKKQAGEIIGQLVEKVTKTLKKGGQVDVPGFGKFVVKHRKARTGINPTTKEKIKIPASKVPGFKPAKALKEAVK